ncbi:hypothetical protein [Glutamicibacter sp. JC586]|nr:hypothetical protein [Glutamicibacter sp. JC586]
MNARPTGGPSRRQHWDLPCAQMPVVGTPAEFYRNFGQPIYP